jgi:hypothetical protein
MGPRTVLEAVVKRKIPSSRRESNRRTPIVQPVAQRYTIPNSHVDRKIEDFVAVHCFSKKILDCDHLLQCSQLPDRKIPVNTVYITFLS